MITVLAVLALLSSFAFATLVAASPVDTSLRRLDIEQMTSLAELTAALDLLQIHLTKAIIINPFLRLSMNKRILSRRIAIALP